MGRWMEIWRERPPTLQQPDQQASLIVAELHPGPLIYAAHRMGRKAQPTFPMLAYVGIDSAAYVDESLWLAPDETRPLLAEVQRLRQICQYDTFLPDINGKLLWDNWRSDDDPQDFTAELDQIEQQLDRAAQSGYWIHLML